MVNLKIDGKAVQAEQGDTILKVARREGFVIPTLCYHETLGPNGTCKICTVEVTEGEKKRTVASCLYPAREGMEVVTDSEAVRQARKEVLEGFLARCPSSEVIRAMAAEYGVAVDGPADPQNRNKCILCNICVKTCKNVVGVAALEMIGKGADKKVGPRADDSGNGCIACGACVVACPTGHIVMTEEKGVRSVWGKEFTLAVCSKCGREHAPLSQLQWISGRTGVAMDALMVCLDCK